MPIKGMRLMGAVLALFALAATARAEPPEGAMDALKQMRDKLEREERELLRLSEMALIPAGTFDMGSAAGAQDEAPVHRVTLESFYIGKYEVTQLQYEKWMGENPSYFGDCPRCPVERVTHVQAAAYCARVGLRLPTEAEWERAARGGEKSPYFWGDGRSENFAWFGNNSGQRTRPVGTREANGFGLFDMAGNVWEWVADWYDANYYAASPDKNPPGPPAGSERVARGGGWGHSPEMIRHGVREHHDPKTRYINGGFRCAKSADKK